jgi:hypothetical protein
VLRVIYVASVCLIMRSSCVTSVISLSDNKEFMCYECHISVCGISLSDNKEFMCYECHICGISLSDNEEFMCYECHQSV